MGGDNKIQWNLSIMDTIRTTKLILYMEVSLIQWLNNAVKYYCGTKKVSLIERGNFINRFHFTSYMYLHVNLKQFFKQLLMSYRKSYLTIHYRCITGRESGVL